MVWDPYLLFICSMWVELNDKRLYGVWVNFLLELWGKDLEKMFFEVQTARD